MANEYYVQIEQMERFIDENNIYIFSALYNYAYHYNYAWYCALKSPGAKTTVKAYVESKRHDMKKAGTLPAYSPQNRLIEYNKLISSLPKEMLIDWREENIERMEE